MTSHGPRQLLSGSIPQLDIARRAAYRQVFAALAPCRAGYGIFGGAQIAQLGDTACGSTPEVDATAQSYSWYVLGGPI